MLEKLTSNPNIYIYISSFLLLPYYFIMHDRTKMSILEEDPFIFSSI